MTVPDDWMKTLSGDIQVRVTPRAASNRIEAQTSADGAVSLRVYVTAVPEDGRANAAVIDLLAKQLHLAKSRIAVLRGETSRNKVIRISR